MEDWPRLKLLGVAIHRVDNTEVDIRKKMSTCHQSSCFEKYIISFTASWLLCLIFDLKRSSKSRLTGLLQIYISFTAFFSRSSPSQITCSIVSLCLPNTVHDAQYTDMCEISDGLSSSAASWWPQWFLFLYFYQLMIYFSYASYRLKRCIHKIVKQSTLIRSLDITDRTNTRYSPVSDAWLWVRSPRKLTARDSAKSEIIPTKQTVWLGMPNHHSLVVSPSPKNH